MFSLLPILGISNFLTNLIAHFSSLDPMALVRALPGNISQGLIWGIMSIGLYITFKILDFADLTIDGTLATGGAVTVMLILAGYPPIVAVLMAVLAGMVAGFITGILHTVFGIPAILAGILTQIALYSVNLNITGGKANQAVSVDQFDLIVSLRYIPKTIAVTAALTIGIIALLYWFFGTEMGFTIRATGCNPNMSRAQGINTSAAKVLALVFSNGLVGFAGGILAQYQGNCDVNMGRGAIVIGLASIIIGEVLGEAMFGKRLNFWSRLLFVAFGSIIYYVVINFVCWLGLPSIDLKLFSAIVVAIFLAVPYMKSKAKNSYRRAAKGGA